MSCISVKDIEDIVYWYQQYVAFVFIFSLLLGMIFHDVFFVRLDGWLDKFLDWLADH